MGVIKKLLISSKGFFIVWCMVAAFGTYFCMYAFRKPFNAGTYEGLSLWGINYKVVLIIAQVFGYMISKFIGIKVISELKAASRTQLIIGLILFAEIALLLFGWVPHPYNFVFLFMNGLPLGMIWGIVFSYLEGRRFTEILAIGLSVSLIVSSGMLKTIYFDVHEWLPAVTEFWMPFVMGLLFLPLFLLFVWMLSVIPAPSQDDMLARAPRLPMTNTDKRNVFRQYGWGLVAFIILYTFLATLRDFRDNFTVEIWNEVDPGWDKNVFTQTEAITSIIVLAVIGSLSAIKNNFKGFWVVNGIIGAGFLITALATFLFQKHMITPFWWMLLLGTGLFLAYMPMQIALFERLIAHFRIKANAGFFVYMCDSIGYLGSVVLMLYKEFFMKEMNWSLVLMKFTYLQAAISLVLLAAACVFFYKSAVRAKNDTAPVITEMQSA
ncbi:DUF5690 family protein [Agriterribacter sp.]|uniref:DUF5690 family protein n=1 Tax=Agriterribacter sp. TaxID=2821509 RepID=UPI002BE46211|nr:DUF5690 family protein [Agriterribacter sp.]HTN07304.1 DUF5690 family protein [Agriterribacter sp.]